MNFGYDEVRASYRFPHSSTITETKRCPYNYGKVARSLFSHLRTTLRAQCDRQAVLRRESGVVARRGTRSC
jgi:hypothetical protein